jgi:hypothetical protein
VVLLGGFRVGKGVFQLIRVRGIVLGLVVAALGSASAWAQIAIYGQATGATLQFPNSAHMYGGTFGFYDVKPVGPITIGADFRGALLGRGSSVGPYNSTALDMGQLGVRVAVAPGTLHFARSLMPYAEALIGLGYWRGGVGVTRQDAKHSMEQIIVGADYAIKPHVHWRVVEFSYGRAGAAPGHINPMTLSTGIVLQLP